MARRIGSAIPSTTTGDRRGAIHRLESISLVEPQSSSAGPRRYPNRKRSRFDDALWVLLAISPIYGFFRYMSGAKNVPEAGEIGLVVLAAWTLFQVSIAWFLWHTSDRVQRLEPATNSLDSKDR